MLQNAKSRIDRRLQPLHHVEQLLHLRLQLDDVFVCRMSANRREAQERCKHCRGEETVAKCV
jgi:hypothetical protein